MAYHRLRSPEEYGDEGTKEYTNAKAANAIAECTLSGVTLKSGCRPGTIIRGLKAQVTAANKLQAVNTPTIIYNELPTQLPDLGNANVVVCGTNIENFFVTLGGYAGASSETTLGYQKQKISKGLYHLNADIYAICEMEQGPLAATEMVRLLNELAGTNVYDWVNAGFSTYDAIMVCYIYRKDKVTPYGNYIKPYTSSVYLYREAIQCFEHIATQERFNVSVNHFKAKSGTDDTDGTRRTNMQRLISKLSSAEAIDPDVLVMGDLNAYTMEASNLLLTEGEGYVDLLMKYDPDGYSYVYDKLVGYLDHAYCSPSMESQVTKAVSYHMNADTPTSYEYSKGNTTMYRYADHEPILVGLHLGEEIFTNVEEVETGVKCTKVLRDGQIIILRGDKAYTITGQPI
jgi:predicted extracellular nuclease